MNDEKSVKNMSIAVDKDLKEKISIASKKIGKTNSALIRHIVEKYIHLEVNESDDTNFVLQIPVEFSSKEKEVELRKWLQVRVDSIVNVLTKEKNGT